MVDNTARVYANPDSEPGQTPQPNSQPRPQVQTAPLHKTRVRFSAFERVMTVTLGLLAAGMAGACVSAQVNVATTQRTYQKEQGQIEQVNKGIANFEQAVSELTDSERLSSFAKAHGLTVVEGSVKQAVK
ncbi:cell division protein FtsL [Lacticaseibacillus zhaodongensis]|uniref:cell division protein FtsL n=1 Tax=Lacticaseibacillus zhaodongensis TaxID=2668065 RepID=UPI0012D33E09|nr:hypothetical protein [Lacticaseibacillus zhaodongensis]